MILIISNFASKLLVLNFIQAFRKDTRFLQLCASLLHFHLPSLDFRQPSLRSRFPNTARLIVKPDKLSYSITLWNTSYFKYLVFHITLFLFDLKLFLLASFPTPQSESASPSGQNNTHSPTAAPAAARHHGLFLPHFV